MSDIVAFLRARLAETKAAAADVTASDWPAFIVDMCDTQLRIIDDLQDGPRESLGIGQATGEHLLAVLALPWANYPDYREEWRP